MEDHGCSEKDSIQVSWRILLSLPLHVCKQLVVFVHLLLVKVWSTFWSELCHSDLDSNVSKHLHLQNSTFAVVRIMFMVTSRDNPSKIAEFDHWYWSGNRVLGQTKCWCTIKQYSSLLSNCSDVRDICSTLNIFLTLKYSSSTLLTPHILFFSFLRDRTAITGK